MISYVRDNPEYEYYLFDDQSALAFMQRFYLELAKLYDLIIPGAMRADLWRLAVIYKYGGVYFDSDSQSLAPLRTFIWPNASVVTGMGTSGDFHQWALLYSPKHVIIKATSRVAITRLKEVYSREKGGKVSYTTSPAAFNAGVTAALAASRCPLKIPVQASELAILAFLPNHYWDNDIGVLQIFATDFLGGHVLFKAVNTEEEKNRVSIHYRVAQYDKMLRMIKILSFVAFCCCRAYSAHRQEVNADHSHSGATVLYNESDDEGLKVKLVVCVIVSYIHLYYYFMGFDSTGPFVLTMFRIVSSDVPYFMTFYLLVVVATACALSLLSSGLNPGAAYGFGRLIKAIWTLIQDTVGVNNTTHDHINDVMAYPQHLQWMVDIILTFYYVTVVILMLNLLIATANDTYAAYSKYNKAILLIAKYNIMNAMEWVMWPHELKDNRRKYAEIAGFGEKKADGVVGTTGSKKQSVHIHTQATTAKVAPAGEAANDSAVLVAAQATVELEHPPKYLFRMETVEEEWYGGGKKQFAASLEAAHLGVVSASSATGAGDYIAAANARTTLFIVHPQRDFHPGGSLAIAAAQADSERIAAMIDAFGHDIHDIYVSMDSHYTHHIAHAVSWHLQGRPNARPKPRTKITNRDVLDKKWIYGTGSDEEYEWAKEYTAYLERTGRLVLTIWPQHCIVGTPGHSVVPVINAALQRWADRSDRPVNYVMVGQNNRVEMYSALRAEVPHPLDMSTGLNIPLLAQLKSADRLLVCGQAMSHCVNYTTRDLIENWDKPLSTIVLLTDGASPVEGFEAQAEDFKNYCTSCGVTQTTTTKAFLGCKPAPESSKRRKKAQAAQSSKGKAVSVGEDDCLVDIDED